MFKNLSLDALGVSGRSSEIIELALSYGFKGFDWDAVDFAEQVKTAGLAHSRRLIDSARLQLANFRLPVTWQTDATDYKRDMDGLAKYAELAQQLNCTRAITAIEAATDMRPYHENFELHRRRFTEIAEALAPYKIRLGLEFHAPASHRQGRAFQFIQSFDAVLQLLKTISAPNVGLALDVWDWHLGGGTLEQLQSLSGEKIVSLSLADADPGATAANADESSRRLPGETGVIDSSAVLTTLAERGFDGPVTPKPSKEIFQGQSREKIVKAAGAALDQVWKGAGLNPAGKVGLGKGVGSRG